jgi:hypothetical protein
MARGLARLVTTQSGYSGVAVQLKGGIPETEASELCSEGKGTPEILIPNLNSYHANTSGPRPVSHCRHDNSSFIFYLPFQDKAALLNLVSSTRKILRSLVLGFKGSDF